MQPRYDQKTFSEEDKHNKLLTVVSPFGMKDGGVQIHQDAWFHLSKLNKATQLNYDVKKNGNGVYVFVLEGDVTINEIELNRRDGLGVSDTDQLVIRADSGAEILLMEIPMQ